MALKAVTTVGQLPANVDLAVYQGDDVFVNIVVDDSVVAIDLTTYIPTAEIRSAPGGQLVAAFDATIVDPVTVALHLLAVDSAKLTTKAAWDCQIVDPAGIVTTLAYGAVSVVEQVTP